MIIKVLTDSKMRSMSAVELQEYLDKIEPDVDAALQEAFNEPTNVDTRGNE